MIAPVLFGSIYVEGQVVVALAFAAAILCGANAIGGEHRPIAGWIILGAAGLLAAMSLAPLPLQAISFLSPTRAEMAVQFPVPLGVRPQWSTLTLSPAETVQRLWELALVAAAFVLARYSCRSRRFPRRFAVSVAAALASLSVSEFIFRGSGRHDVLGIWRISWGEGAGTFANRNHFANWLCVGALFCAGWVLRDFSPVLSARPRHRAPSRSGSGYWMGGVILVALALAVASASRAAFASFVAGSAVWAFFLMSRTRSRYRLVGVGAAGAGIAAILIALSGPLMDRLVQTPSDLASPALGKLFIWRESVGLAGQFPWLGTGLGTFETAFGHFKSAGGTVDFLHAENELLESLVEVGILGTLLAMGFVFRLARASLHHAISEPVHEPELVWGAIAALTAFVCHSCFEFVWQMPANAILAAALAGFVVGQRDRAHSSTVPALPSNRRLLFNYGAGLALLFAAVFQGWSFIEWQRGLVVSSALQKVALLERSLQLWPWAVNRHLSLVRARAATLPPDGDPERLRRIEAIHDGLTQGLRLDPFNVDLRLEQAWFDLTFRPSPEMGAQEGLAVISLRPLQSRIPLLLAQRFAEIYPEQARQFLLAGRYESSADVWNALELVYRMTGDASALWEVTPNTEVGLDTLRRFALQHDLHPLALTASELLGRPGL